jgi:hypothetical protein
LTYGVQGSDASGNIFWDSSNAKGGVVADSREIASGASAEFTYPAYAGHTPYLVQVLDLNPQTITVDTALGYPRVTVTAGALLRRFLLAVR